jgi:hypothetical protein
MQQNNEFRSSQPSQPFQPSQSFRPHKSHRVRNTVLIIIFAIFVLLIAWCVTLGVQARHMIAETQSAQSALTSYAASAKQALTSGNKQQVTALATDPRLANANDALAAVDHTIHGPQWTALTVLPGYGQDVTLARGLAHAGHELTSQVLPPFISGAQTALTARLTNNGTINTQALTRISSQLSTASTHLTSTTSFVQSLPTGSIPQLQSARSMIANGLTTLSTSSRTGIQVLNLMTRLLTSPTQHTWVLAGVTPAEIRSSAGLIGSIGEMKIGQGKIAIDSFSPNTSFIPEGPIIQSDESIKLFQVDGFKLKNNSAYSFDARDIGVDPDFAGMAKSLITVWTNSPSGRGSNPQGVIAIDPVCMQQLIAASGTITAPDGTVLTGTNAAAFLNNGIYIKHPNNQEQDALFAAIVSMISERMVSNLNGKMIFTLMRGFTQLVDGRHVQAYSTDPSIQHIIGSLGLTRAPQASATHPTLGLYVNSYNSSKMDFYNKRTVSVRQTGGPTRNGIAGQRTYTVRLKVANTLTPQLASQLPAYVLAGRQQRDALSEFLLIYAPQGGSVKVDRSPTLFAPFTWNGKSLLRTVYQIGPQSSANYTLTVTTSAHATSGLTVDQSPACQ